MCGSEELKSVWCQKIVMLNLIYLLCMTQQDAAGLTQLSSTVEDVFASGDLPRAAETLANMRHCLSAVGEVIFFLKSFLFSTYNVNQSWRFNSLFYFWFNTLS